MTLGLLAVPGTASGAPGEQPVPRFTDPPQIDGRLDEAEWREAAELGVFVQTYPAPGAQPTAATAVRVGFDDSAMYLGIRAGDDPARVRAALHARDELADDDVVAIYLDTFGDHSRAYALRFNPLGVQQDGVFLEGGGTDLSVDLKLRSVGRLTADGYELEIGIPFSSLRYPRRTEQVWGLQILRQARSRGEESSWRPLPREHAVRFPLERKFLLAGAGVLRIPDALGGGRWLEAIPTVSATAEARRVAPGSQAGWREEEPAAHAGFTVRAGWGRNLVVEGAHRPDYGEVEADPPILTVNNPFPLFLAERRPFFLEGLDLLRTLATTVDTRRIEAPESALKGTWQGGRDAVAVVVAREDGRSQGARDAMLARYRRTLGEEAWVGVLVTQRQTAEHDNTVASVDGRFRLGPRATLAAQLSASQTEGSFYDPAADRVERRRGSGLGYAADLDHRAERVSFRLSALGFSRDYRADLGYVARTDTHRLLAETRYSPPARPAARLVSWAFLHTVLAQADSGGRMQYAYLYPRAELTFRGQTYLNLALYLDYRQLIEEDFGPRRAAGRPGAFFGAAERSTIYNGGTITLGTNAGKRWGAEVSLDTSWNTLDYDFGAGPKYPRVSPAALADPAAPLDPGPGDTRSAALTLRWQPSERWLASLTFSNDRLVRDDTGLVAYDANLASLKVERHFSKSTLARVRIDHDSLASRFAARFLFAWQPTLGTALYVGYDDDRAHDGFDPWSGAPEPGWRRTGRAAFVKLSYALRRDWRRGTS